MSQPRWRLRAIATLTLLALSFPYPGSAAGTSGPGRVYGVVNIDRVGPSRLESLKAARGIDWWVELDDQLLVYGAEGAVRSIGRAFDVRVLPDGDDPSDLRVVYVLHGEDASAQGLRVLAQGGHAAVVAGGAGRAHHHPGEDVAGPYENHAVVRPLVPDSVLAQQAANRAPGRAEAFDASTQALVDSVNADRWYADLQTLATYNRWSRGTNILAARDWLVSQFQAMPGLTVETQPFTIPASGSNPAVTAYNVIATLPGTTRPDDWYIVGGHYDAISNNDNNASAHGAEDNGSGTCAVLEMARVFTAHPPDATVKFMCYAGEEQGLYGSTANASQLVSSGDSAKVRAVLTMDMIAYTGDSDLDCLLETGAIGQFLINAYSAAAAQYTTLRIVTSLNPFGSDHVPYLDRGMPALLTIENDYNTYPNYHRSGDVVNSANINVDLALQTMRMNVGALADMAGDEPLAPRGSETPGLYDPAAGAWFLKNSNAPGPGDLSFFYGPGNAGWVPITGDWNGDGVDTIGLYEPTNATFFLRNVNAPGAADVICSFGPGGQGWVPLVGDWDGNGTDTVGAYSPASGFFFLRNSNTNGPADIQFGFGPPNATPVVGDWDGNGTDTVGIYVGASSVFFLRNVHAPGVADVSVAFGPAGAGWRPVPGDWNGENTSTPGLFSPSAGTWFLRNSNTPGVANFVFQYGPAPSTMTPLRGDWDGV